MADICSVDFLPPAAGRAGFRKEKFAQTEFFTKSRKEKRKMKRFFIFSAFALAVCHSAYAGGVMANTNQSVQFIRSLARGTSLDADAAYYNPAGTAFMTDGIHFTIGNQFVVQNRQSQIDFAPFEGNGGNSTKSYGAKTFAPLLPNIDLVWKKGNFALMGSFGIGGGGGTAEYGNGLGAFEQQISVIPTALSSLGYTTTDYGFDTNIVGKQITYAANLGLAVKLAPWLSFAAQVRFNYVQNSYEGYIRNIMINPNVPALGMTGSMVSAPVFFNTVAQAMQESNPAISQMAAGYALATADKELEMSQSGWGVTPVLALAFDHKGWHAAVKYEFRNAISLKNSVVKNTLGLAGLDSDLNYDQPAMLTAALSKKFVDKVKVTVQWNYYFDKDARMDNILSRNNQRLIDRNTQEYLLGVEWDVHKR